MAVGDAHMFPGFLLPALTQLFFPKPPTTFLTCFCRGERGNTLERNVASTGYRTHYHQVMSQTRSPLSHLGWIFDRVGNIVEREIYFERLTLFQKTILDASKLKEFADDNVKVDENDRKFSK